MDDILDYTWLESPWNQLQQWQLKGRLPHALLIRGQAGIGKTLLARQFSRWLHCDHSENGLTCGRCASCHQFSAGTHPDFLEITLEQDKRIISIDQIRQISEFLSLSSINQKQRIVLIQPAECMNDAAMNALLKTLEEPPGKALLLLVTNRPGRLSATIRSRCQMMTCSAPDPEQGLDWLTRHSNAEEDMISLSMKLADHSPLRAYDLLKSDNMKNCQAFMHDFSHFLQGKIDHIEMASRYEKQEIKDLLYHFLLDILKILSEKGRAQIPVGKTMGINITIPDIVQQLQPEKVLRCVEKLKKGLTPVSVSLNPRLFLEDILIELI